MKGILNKVIVKSIKEVEKSGTGIIIDTNKDVDKGEVVAKGKEVTDELEIGDIVVFSEYAGKKIKVDDVEYILLNQLEINAIL